MATVARPSGIDVPGPGPGAIARGRLTALILGPGEQANWVRPALVGVTLLAAVLYLWDLTVSGWANTYYSMAAQAASQSWSAWFFGSLDSANFITLDKPPLATMLMGLSVRVLGLSPWAILLPQALAGIATVVVLYHAVRRSFGPVAATIAGVLMALTPVAVLIFRYDNPDALLTLLLVGAAAALLRALDDERLRWVALAAALVGLGFLTKYLQAYLVLPAFALTYGIAASGNLRHRLTGLAVALATVVLVSGWWVAIVEAIPAADRPFIGGSTTNSVLELIFGYDGLGRIFGLGGGGGPAGSGGPGAGFSGEAGVLRLFNPEFGGQISWLIPFAAVALVSGLWLRREADRRDRAVAGYLLWGTWFVTHAVVFSFMTGIVHTYYAVALAPAIAALVGAGTVELWQFRARSRIGGVLLGGAVAVSAIWAWALLERTPGFAPGLGWVILGLGGFAAVVLAMPAPAAAAPTTTPTAAVPPSQGARRLRHLGLVGAGLAAIALIAGPAAYAADSVGVAYSGGDPSAGPAVANTDPFGGNGLRGPFGGGPVGGGRFGGVAGVPGGTTDQALIEYLVANRGDARWLVAASGSGNAAPIQLATGQPVMSMGGFNGSDDTPTLTDIQRYVASGELRFVLLGGGGPGGGFVGRGLGGFGLFGEGARAVNAWITANCRAVNVGSRGGGPLYDCAPTTGT